jgi:hypothetical protein
MGTQMNNVLVALEGQLFALTINQVRWAALGNVFSFPVTTGIEGLTYGGTEQEPDNIPRFLDFVGRTQGGRRARMAIFGFKGALSLYRVTVAEVAAIGTALGNLQGGANSWLGIDGLKPVWHPYVNVGFNAYWQRKVRA